jgi:hypothetical protein
MNPAKPEAAWQSLSVSLTVVALLHARFDVAFTLARRRLAERLCQAASDKAKTNSDKKVL